MRIEHIRSPEIHEEHRHCNKLYHEDEVEGSLICNSFIVEHVPIESQESVQFHQEKSLENHHLAPFWKELHEGAVVALDTHVVVDADEEDHQIWEQVVAETVDWHQMNWFKTEEVFVNKLSNPDTVVKNKEWHDDQKKKRFCIFCICRKIWYSRIIGSVYGKIKFHVRHTLKSKRNDDDWEGLRRRSMVLQRISAAESK